jgi:hypothetical protein
MTHVKTNKTEREEAKTRMLDFLERGDTVHTILEHVSKSGMQRTIRLVVLKVDDNGKPFALHPNYLAGRVLDVRQETRRAGDGLIVRGCGMDMGFDLVYRLSHALFGDGYALKHAWL